MESPAVVEHFDIIDHVLFGFLPCGITTMLGLIALEASKEALGDGIVPAVAFAAHAADHAVFRQQCLIVLAGILTASIRMVDQSSVRLSDQEGHA